MSMIKTLVLTKSNVITEGMNNRETSSSNSIDVAFNVSLVMIDFDLPNCLLVGWRKPKWKVLLGYLQVGYGAGSKHGCYQTFVEEGF